jgi:hypothetical protein
MKNKDIAMRVHTNPGDRSQHFTLWQYKPPVHDVIPRRGNQVWCRA